jgi:hypothetical protein
MNKLILYLPFFLLLLLLLNRLPTDITVGQGLEKTYFYNFLYNFYNTGVGYFKRDKSKQKKKSRIYDGVG